MVITGANRVQVQEFRVCGRIGRKKINLLDISSLVIRKNTVLVTFLSPFSDLSCFLVNVWVMLTQPWMSQDQRMRG